MTETDESAGATVPEAPLLHPLGDADAAVCTDGFCVVSSAETSTGADQ